ncbi:MAG: molybdopterin cofactor-binding domain-containing protein, partial [Thermodesulfobacteriota bacterium]|nr:molybdopterin cofactor-binding domain-containing protein [Thermodesulfobacteriota bacterium]
MSEYNVINRRTPRVDAPDKATGRAMFIDDLTLPGMLHGALLQSQLPHAKILNIDTSRAEKLPGVKAVITAEDGEGRVKYGVSPARYDETLFCYDRVRYVGDEIAAVAAVDLATALEAVSLIKVDYEELPAVFDPVEAMKEDAPQLHEDYPGNINAQVRQEFGDVERALKECDLVRKDIFRNKRQDGAFIEPHGAIGIFDERGYLTLYSTTQMPHYVQRDVARVLGLSVGKVRVIKKYVGGGFGPKGETTPLDFSAALLSIKTGKPVKMLYTRKQVFLHSRARHQFVHKLTIGVKRDGTIMALKNEALLDGGAYT